MLHFGRRCLAPGRKAGRQGLCQIRDAKSFRKPFCSLIFSQVHEPLPWTVTKPTGVERNRRCCNSVRPAATEDDVVRYAAVGDIVSVHFVMRDENGKVLQSSATDLEEPLSFQVGAGDMMGNRLFQGFDEAVRGMAVGQTTVLEASGGEWRRELMFAVPREHPEVQRLEGRYKNHGGLAPGLVVELSNGGMACILEVSDSEVKLDANNMLAGKTFTIELELVSIDTVSSDT